MPTVADPKTPQLLAPDKLREIKRKHREAGRKLRELEQRARGIAPPANAGQAHRDTMAERSRAQSLSVRDIGELPAVAHPQRRARAAKNFLYFCKQYFPEIFFLPWSDDHRTVARKIETVVREGGRFALAMPRHSGKTAITVCAVLWAVLYGHREYVVIIAANEGKAEELLRVAKSNLFENPRLAEDFPEVCYPIARLDRIAQRRLLYRGRPLAMEFTARRMVLPNIPGVPSASAALTFAGITGSLRGMVFPRPDGRIVRPSLVILDDPQTDESARSPQQCAERERIVKHAVLGLAGPGVELAVLLTCTVVSPGDLADRFLDRKQNPEWQAEKMKLVYHFPTDKKLWAEYNEIRREELIAGGDGKQATAFYRQRRRAMDAGARVAWRAMFRPKELSGIQYAMNLMAEDRRMFFAEYQNEPLAEAEQRKGLTGEHLATKLNGRQPGQVPQTAAKLTAFVDVHDDLLYWAAVAWGKEFEGSLLGYGTWPQQHDAYFTLDNARQTLPLFYPGHGKEGAIYAGLAALLPALLSRSFPRDDGAAMHVDLCLVDTGYVPDVVGKAIRTLARGAALMPSRGYGITAAQKPYNEYKREAGVQQGFQWRIAKAPATQLRTVNIDANWWKSFLRDRLLAAIGDKGCLSIFGPAAEPQAHRMFVDHCLAEYAEPTFGRGRWVDQWRMRPNGPDNHWWDCLVGCTVAASVSGITMEEMGGVPVAVRRRVKMSDVQKGGPHSGW